MGSMTRSASLTQRRIDGPAVPAPRRARHQGPTGFARGRYDDAERLAHGAFELGRACGVMEAQAHFMGQLYRVRLAQGRLAELVPTFEAIVRGHPEHPAPQITLCGAYAVSRHADAEALSSRTPRSSSRRSRGIATA